MKQKGPGGGCGNGTWEAANRFFERYEEEKKQGIIPCYAFPDDIIDIIYGE